MGNQHREDILIDTLHDIRNAVDDCLKQIETGKSSNSDYLIDRAEDELHKLTLKTNEIYTEMISREIEAKETKEVIESKKANI